VFVLSLLCMVALLGLTYSYYVHGMSFVLLLFIAIVFLFILLLTLYYPLEVFEEEFD